MDALERLVGAYAVYNTRVGYCQSMNLIGGHLLLALGCGSGWADPLGDEIEEAAFWLLRYLAEEIVPTPDIICASTHPNAISLPLILDLLLTGQILSGVGPALLG